MDTRKWAVVMLSSVLFFLPIVSAAALTIVNPTLESKKRVGRTLFEYTYRASISNTGADVSGVIATVTSRTPNTTVVDDTLIFGAVAGGASEESANTFTIRQDRRFPFVTANLDWTIQALPTPIPDPSGGVLLGGSPATPALDSVADRLGTAVPDTDVSSGLILTRLEGAISPTATVDDINNALQSVSGSIDTMFPRIPVVSLVIPRVTNLAEANAVAQSLIDSGAFLWVSPSYEVQINLVPPNWSPSSTDFDHLERIRAPALWNLRDYIIPDPPATRTRTPVLIADFFASLTTPSDMAAISYIGSSTTSGSDRNHGTAVMSTIGSQFNNIFATAVHPDPDSSLDLQAVTISGGWVPVLQSIQSAFPSGNFVLNTSLGYNDPGETSTPLWRRANLALVWNGLAGGNANRFVHAASAGNDGGSTAPGGGPVDSRINSPFNTAAKYANPCVIIPAANVAQRNNCEATRTATINGGWSHVSSAIDNVIVVSGVDNAGAAWSGSTQPGDVSAVAVDVLMLCQFADSDCDGNTISTGYNGTSFSSPQVAAVAATMWTLDSSLTVAEIIKRITDSPVNSNIVDAYAAALAIDKNINNPSDAKVRMALFDVVDDKWDGVDTTITPDDKFGIGDLRRFVSEITTRRGLTEDRSRFDLNGDGFTGGAAPQSPSTHFSFDLNGNGTIDASNVSQVIEGVSASFSEANLSDAQILCYYAYSKLYPATSTNDKVERTIIMLPILDQCGVTLSAIDLKLNDSSTSGWNLPVTMQLFSFDPALAWPAFWSGTGTCGSEQASPLWSSQVDAGAYFLPAEGVSNHPAPANLNRRGCSTFFAVRDGRIWFNATAGSWRISGGFISEREYQVRYSADPNYVSGNDPMQERRNSGVLKLGSASKPFGSFGENESISTPNVEFAFTFN